MDDETVQNAQDKLFHIKHTLETQNAVVKMLYQEIARVNFREVSKVSGFKQDVAKIFTLTDVEKRSLPGYKTTKVERVIEDASPRSLSSRR